MIALLIAAAAATATVPQFDAHFTDATLRIDYTHTGDATSEIIALDSMRAEGAWAGSRRHLLDPFGNGRYVVRLIDPETGAVLFSRGYDSMFGEYRTTGPAAAGVARTFQETALVPMPRHPMRFVVGARDRDTIRPLLELLVDPASPLISREPLRPGAIVIVAADAGDPHRALDLAVLGEGYTAAEEAKFRADLARFASLLLAQEPYASLRDRVSVRGVLVPSADSGVDEPSRGNWRRSALGASFDSFGSERYLLTEDNRAVRDAAAHVPADALVIMVNTGRYGGGGIYNAYCTFTSDNQWSGYTLLHELGHSLFGLADEYYTSSVAFSDFYAPGVEPHEPNITALRDPAALKWRELVTPGTPVPTPWEKQAFDEMDLAYQKVRQEINDRIAARSRARAPAEEIEKLKAEGERLSAEHAARVDAFLGASTRAGEVGAFEGAGYASQGLYRPMVDCLMFSKGVKPLCRVCQAAAARVIAHFGE